MLSYNLVFPNYGNYLWSKTVVKGGLGPLGFFRDVILNRRGLLQIQKHLNLMLPYRYIKIVYDGEFSAYGMQQLLTALLLIGDINLYGVISPRILRFSSTIYSFSCSPTICPPLTGNFAWSKLQWMSPLSTFWFFRDIIHNSRGLLLVQATIRRI